MSWWAFKPKIKYSTTFDIKLCSGRQCHRGFIAQFFVANANDNDRRLKANVNKFSNDNVWNSENRNRIVVPRNSMFLLHLFGGVFFSRPFFQPPSILPISSRFPESVEYFSLGIHLFSQAICRKNFTPSSLEIAVRRRAIFVSGGRYIDIKIFSKRPRK